MEAMKFVYNCCLLLSLVLVYFPHQSFASGISMKKGLSVRSSRRRNLSASNRSGNHATRRAGVFPGLNGRKHRLRSMSSSRSLTSTIDWSKAGQNVEGKQLGSQFGDSVAISKNGNMVAVGARFKDTLNGSNSGVVRVFRRNVNGDGEIEWVQQGSDIEGESKGDFLGKSIALSGDGSVIAVGSPRYDEHGMVRVFRFDEGENEWKKVGNDFGGISTESPIGCLVSLSGDGLTIAISWDGHEGTGLCVRIFKLQDDDWVESSTKTLLPIEHKNCPSISLSENGDILAMGGVEIPHHLEEDIDHGDTEEPGKGRVRVYQLVQDEWTYFGQVIDEDVDLGRSVSLSDDGRTLATSGDGIVRVYHLKNETWVPDNDITQIADGTDTSNEPSVNFGRSVSLSGDGMKIAIGDPQDFKYCENTEDECVDGPGFVQVYQLLEGKDWSSLGSIVQGRTILNNGDRFGFSVALSQNGQTLIAGAPNRHMANLHGYFSVFDLIEKSDSPPSQAPTTVEDDNSSDDSLPGTSSIISGPKGPPLSTAAQISIGSIGGFLVAAVGVFLVVRVMKRRNNEELRLLDPPPSN